MNNKIKEIKSRRQKFDSKNFSGKSYVEMQKRLKTLVDQHGFECVSEATGLTVGTIQQYVRVTVAPAISRNTIEKAELILQGL